jgi:hypothetical protein
LEHGFSGFSGPDLGLPQLSQFLIGADLDAEPEVLDWPSVELSDHGIITCLGILPVVDSAAPGSSERSSSVLLIDVSLD